jgi:hypothetical protein
MPGLRTILWTMAAGILALHSSMGAEPTDTNVCELVRNPFAFSGKMVRIHAEVYTFFEIAEIRAECDHKLAAIALYYPDFVRDSDRPDFGLLKDKNFKQFDQALSEYMNDICVGPSPKKLKGRVYATFVGRFDGPDKLTVTDNNGNTVVRKGYGLTPSTLFPTRIILKSVSNVTISK